MEGVFKNKKVLVIIFAFIILCFISFFSIRMGSINFTYSEIIKGIFGSEFTGTSNIIINIRLPRIIIALLVGANLAVSGALLQAVMQNPLADPGITGVSSGAALAALTILLAFPEYAYLVPLAAFIGGSIACILVYLMAWKNGIQPLRIVLAGVAINAMLGGGTSLLTIKYSDRIQGALLWLNGSMVGSNWDDVKVLGIYSTIGLIAALFAIRKANVLQLGDEMSSNLGINTNKDRIILSAIAVFLASISTAIIGLIGFVGLIVPHISRLLVGSDHKYMLPLSLILGSSLVLLGDTFARTIFSPIELPVGVIMAILGGPFFLYLLRRGHKC